MKVQIPPEQIDALERRYPGLKSRVYRPSSVADARYNCLAWAVNRNDLFLWPGGDPVRQRWNNASTRQYWPQKYAHSDELTAIQKFLISEGYRPTSNGTLEAGQEKVAVYMRREQVTRRRDKETTIEVAEDPFHLARQREDGWWVSKMGQSIDIEHPSAEELLDIEDNTSGWILREWLVFFGRLRQPATWRSRVLLP